jgi:hypothetical protein
MEALSNLRRAGLFQEKLHGLLKVVLALLHGVALASDVQLRAQRNIAVSIALDNCGQAACRHDDVLPCSNPLSRVDGSLLQGRYSE